MKSTIRRSLAAALLLAPLPVAPGKELDFSAAEAHAANHGRTALEATSAAITTGDLERYVNRLASTEYEGRGTGDRGAYMATTYLATFFEGLSLAPGGEDGSFYQYFDVADGKALAGENTLRIELDEPLGLVRELEAGDDFQPLSFSPSGTVEAAPVFFAGFGIRAEGYDSFEGLDPAGKWLVVLRGSPKDRRDLQPFAPLVAKAQLAKDVGAAGILFVKGPHPGVGKEVMPPETDVGGGEGLPPSLTISDRFAATLLTGDRGGDAFGELFEAHYEAGEIRSFPLPYRVGATITLEANSLSARNVIARLQVGDSPSEETVVIGGHIDHLGYGNRGGTRARGADSERLHLGADDNASGVAAIMELAQHFADRRDAGELDLRRDLIFAGWSGEEIGLHGSRHFVESSKRGEGDAAVLYPAVSSYINLDMVGRLGDRALQVQATASSGAWGGLLDGIETELEIERSPNPYLPTDSSPFYNAGVPILALFSGLHDDYHTPADTVDKIDFDGLAKISNYLTALTVATANLQQAPDYVKVERRRGGPRVLLGIRMEDPGEGEGVSVTQVVADSPALRAGVKEGDLIESLAGEDVTDLRSLRGILNGLEPEKEYPLRVRRGEEQQELKIVPAARR